MANINISSSWVAVLISTILMCGGGFKAYSELKSTQDVLVAKMESLTNLPDRVTRGEAEREGLSRTQEDIRKAMGGILEELKEMNENLIRLDK